MPRLRLGIRRKLIAAMLAASVLASLALGIAWQLNFQRGFLQYLNARGLDRLDALVPQLEAAYHKYGSWNFVTQRSAIWFELVGLPGGLTTAPPIGSPMPSTRSVDPTGIGLRIALLDDQHRFIIGIPQVNPTAIQRAVIVDGRTVGWVALMPIEKATSAIDQRFQRQQQLLLWIIGLLAVAVAGLGAIWLARAFLTPIQSIAGATRQLTAGDFSVRLPAGSSDEIGQLASDVNQLAFTLQRADQQRRSLMADVSHELRTPLAVLRGEIEAIQDGVRSSSPSNLQSLLSEVRILEKLVDDIYDVARSDIGALSYRRDPLLLQPLLDNCVAAFQERFASRALRLDYQPPPPGLQVLGDETRLQQLFNNLFENCVRYTDAGGQIRITAGAAGQAALIVVEDSAPGVTDEQLGRLFERFYRAEESRNRASGGAGLGLTICRNIAEAHGGSITAGHSELGGVRLELRLQHP